jgi:hypothetical protein
MSYDHFFIPDAATLQADQLSLKADAHLANEGFDPATAQPINAPKIIGEAFEVETIYDVNQHTWGPKAHVAEPDGVQPQEFMPGPDG